MTLTHQTSADQTTTDQATTDRTTGDRSDRKSAPIDQEYFARPVEQIIAEPDAIERVRQVLDALEDGSVRAAYPTDEHPDGWVVNRWVKHAVLAAFRLSPMVEFDPWPASAVDKVDLEPRRFRLADQVRLVPGGSAVRRGAHLAPGTVVMPPSYVNLGAHVGSGSMLDSHVLVGSCAQIGADVHLSAGVQVGGVLEPVGAVPVIVEDGAFIGGQCGLYEGVRVGAGAVLAPGTMLTSGTVLHDLVEGGTRRGHVPPGAVVVPGARPARGPHAAGIQLYAPCIVKYRDAGTDAATTLEEALR